MPPELIERRLLLAGVAFVPRDVLQAVVVMSLAQRILIYLGRDQTH